jgi:hypothetical protein
MLPRVTACADRSASSSPLKATNADASASRAARAARRSARAAVSAVSTASRARRSPSRARPIAAEAWASSPATSSWRSCQSLDAMAPPSCGSVVHTGPERLSGRRGR